MSTSATVEDAAVSDRKYVAPRAKLQLSDFNIHKRLGDGSFSYVIKVTLKTTGVQYALKVVDKHLVIRNHKVENLKRERQLLDRLDHPGIVKLHFTFQDEASLYFGLELCPNGELFEQIQVQKWLPSTTAQFYAAEIVLILEYLRSEEVVHLDLKPENLLLDAEGHLKLIDFGCARSLRLGEETNTGGAEGLGRSLSGTADYVSPETLEGKPASYEADLWAFGCVLYQMVHGKPPFRAASEYLTFQKISARDIQFSEDVTLETKDLIDRLLATDPADRIGSGNSGFKELKGHPFFEGIQWKTLRSLPPPPFVSTSAGGSDADGGDEGRFDWVMRSLAESLPLKYEYEQPGIESEPEPPH